MPTRTTGIPDGRAAAVTTPTGLKLVKDGMTGAGGGAAAAAAGATPLAAAAPKSTPCPGGGGPGAPLGRPRSAMVAWLEELHAINGEFGRARRALLSIGPYARANLLLLVRVSVRDPVWSSSCGFRQWLEVGLAPSSLLVQSHAAQ